jgi:hypothetical protein
MHHHLFFFSSSWGFFLQLFLWSSSTLTVTAQPQQEAVLIDIQVVQQPPVPLNDSALRDAVALWLEDPAQVMGMVNTDTIQKWDTSEVTNMAGLFKGKVIYELLSQLWMNTVPFVLSLTPSLTLSPPSSSRLGQSAFNEDIGLWNVGKVSFVILSPQKIFLPRRDKNGARQLCSPFCLLLPIYDYL